MSEIITSTEQEILIAHMVDRLPALRKKYGISQTENNAVDVDNDVSNFDVFYCQQ